MKNFRGLFLTIGILFTSSAYAQEGRKLTQEHITTSSTSRLALVIGNGVYENAPSLKNPPNDATDIAQALSKLGFTVEHGINLTQKQMKFMIREFGRKLRGGGQGLFYFAGHGVQMHGHNYLIPVDADIQSETDVEDQGVDVNLVLGLMDEAGNGLNVFILDACRNNPFARSFRSVSNGLAQIDSPVGTLIAYATAPGSVASDGDTRNGVYTQELLKFMQTPGLNIENVFKQVRISVRNLTRGKQIPWESSSLMGEFYFTGNRHSGNTPKIPSSAAPVDPTSIQLSYWESIKNSTDPEDFRAYLRKYSNGEFADLAKNRIKILENPPLYAPTQISPADGAVFDIYPRTTRLVWSAITGAVSYSVETDFGWVSGWCAESKDCNDREFNASWRTINRNIMTTEFTYNFVGAQPGRWRVWAVGAGGREGPKSPWRTFEYKR